ncbi:MAG: hypothetical protein Q9182_004986 [Xanthomendoza sp. 2 TL-2023]
MSSQGLTANDPLREARLNKFFHTVNHGERSLKTIQDGNRYIEAVCGQSDPAACIENIIATPVALEALQTSFRFDTSDEFLNGAASDLLNYLQDPGLEGLLGGTMLRRILESITKVPIFWKAMVQCHRRSGLKTPAQLSFAWLLLQLMCFPNPECAPYHRLAQDIKIQDSLLKSSNVKLRSIGFKIKHVLSVSGNPDVGGLGGCAGGRHDNDFANFRDIAILPTADELTAKEPPFLRLAETLEDPEVTEHRMAMHLDNQFRLYREDMLGELREEIRIALGQKKGRHRGIVINGLDVLGVDCGTENGEITAFPSIHRDADLLAAMPPVISIKFVDAAEASLAKTLLKLKTCQVIKLVQIDTAIFAYEPILHSLQRMKTLPLANELLFWTPGTSIGQPPNAPSRVIDNLEQNPPSDLRAWTGSSKPIVLDGSQHASLVASLKQTVSLIQGPPGTGKSFIGALTAKIIHDFTSKNILVVCFTNHALDQFLEDLLDIGIPGSAMLRLGNIGKATQRLKALGLHEQATSEKLSRAAWSTIQELKASVENQATKLSKAFERFMKTSITRNDLMEYLDFLSDDINYFEAFTVPRSEDGSRIVGRRGKSINNLYLLDQWCSGQNRGVLSSFPMTAEALRAWALPRHARQSLIDKWSMAILEERVSELCKIAVEHDKTQRQLDETFQTKNINVIQSKRVIGCTTTAAAKYAHELRAASRDALLVEEAGEIFESHVLTALGERTTQLILIGDHKQLRPKAANYELTVEKGEGYDINRSLFERLVLKGFPHHVLTQQHRMRPEISSLVRSLTYPELLDAPKTKGRPSLRGFRDNLIFVDHRHPEDDLQDTANWRDMTSLSSKQNKFEAEMVLKCVKYLAQQGYGSDKIVVLTPYVGQLRLLQQVLSAENDPVLNDLDTADLVRAGLVLPSTNKRSQRKLRLACIDNYQGEESDIVVVTLTRSNTNCDIGFMSAPERLNVLLSRARNAMLIIGNSETFRGSRKGKLCKVLLDDKCEKGHVLTWTCFQGRPKDCPICKQMAVAARKKREKDLKMQQKRDREAEVHAQRLAEIDHELEAIRQKANDIKLTEERSQAVRQKEKDLQAARTKLSAPTEQNMKSRDKPSATNGDEKTVPLKTPNDQNLATKESTQSCMMQTKFTSESRDDWQHQKSFENAANDAIDEIMDLVGLEDVKAQVLRIKAKIDTTKRQNSDVKKERFNAAFLGNPGTGKTTVARLYARVLTSLEVLPGVAFVETTGSRLAHGGVGEAKKHIEDLQKAGGGALFLDEAYQLAQSHTPGGRQVLDFLLAEMENNVGKIVFIVAGYSREMETFFEHNPGLPSRIPYRLRFDDYEDSELLWFLQEQIRKKWEGQMRIDCGKDGLYMRIAVRRVGRGRGRPGFGNARALEITFSKITERQADRLKRERRQGLMPDDFWLSKEDLIGPEPSLTAISESTTWQKLQRLTGLQAVKDSLHSMLHRVVTNYQRELKEKEPIEVSLNRVFLGNPGTGKTSVAKLLPVIIKNPSDFVGQYLGQSESNTKAILASAVGKVLIIDEAYMLYTGTAGGGNQSDSFKTGVIDTIVAEIQSVPGEDRCVLLLGYRDKIETMFRNVNPGLSRRFKIDDAFQFDDFTERELREILESKMKQQDLGATADGMEVAMEVLGRAKINPHFGNAGEVENLLGSAKDRFQKRQNSKPLAERSFDCVFQPQDFDPEFDRAKHANENLKILFDDTVGCEKIIAKLAGYQQIVQGMKARQKDPRGQIPMNFLFKGPPGTGKTTTARKMGQVYYDMGFLSSAEVFECSASDLVGQYVGHTGPKTVAQLDKALGKILFIDEAYRLSEGQYAREAINELVDQLTKPQYLNKLVVILAGYDKDINQLISTNPGLSSRFPEEIIFENMSPERCIQLLQTKLRQNDITIPTLDDVRGGAYRSMWDVFKQLAALPSFGNGREVETLAKTMLGFVYRQPIAEGTLTLSAQHALSLTKTMLHERQERSANMPNTSIEILPRATTVAADSQPPWASQAPSSAAKDAPPPDTSKDDEDTDPSASALEDDPPSDDDSHRDQGVSDEIWNQLQMDKQALIQKEKQDAADLQKQQDCLAKAKALEAERNLALEKLAKQQAEDEAARQLLKRQLEQARLAELQARMERERQLAELEKARIEQARRKEKEVKAQKKLREMGVCVAGFRWIKQAGGYRCAGGSHYVSDQQLGL